MCVSALSSQKTAEDEVAAITLLCKAGVTIPCCLQSILGCLSLSAASLRVWVAKFCENGLKSQFKSGRMCLVGTEQSERANGLGKQREPSPASWLIPLVCLAQVGLGIWGCSAAASA